MLFNFHGFSITRKIEADVLPGNDQLQQPSAPYKRKSLRRGPRPSTVVDGERPARFDALCHTALCADSADLHLLSVSTKKFVVALGEYRMPRELQDEENRRQVLQDYAKRLQREGPLTPENYGQRFAELLHLEEAQMEDDIQM